MIENMVLPKTIHLRPDAAIPNNRALPVLIYTNILEDQTADKAVKFTKHFAENGWTGIWKNGVYDYHHFHSNAHEALGIAKGRVEIQLGGESGERIKLESGDLIVLPAGTGHKRVAGSENLVVIGAYPAGQDDYDTCRNLSECPQAEDRISAVPLPSTDPFYGKNGPLMDLWKK
ncbi:MAG: cupin domain-containing protein [Micavibrio sp.]